MKKYPYPYIGHGIASARKYMGCYLCLKKAPTASEKKWIKSLVPHVMSDSVEWDGPVLYFAHESFLQDVVEETYKKNKKSDPWEAFNQDIDDFVEQVNGKCPVELMIKPIDEEYWTDLDKWHDWTLEHFLEGVFPVLKARHELRDIKYHCAWFWKEYVESKSNQKQEKILSQLSESDINLLKDWECLPSGVKMELRSPPTLEEVEKLLPKLKKNPTGMRIMAAFEEMFPEEEMTEKVYLITYPEELLRKKEYKRAIAMAELILEDGAVAPGHWYEVLVKAYLKTGEMKKAEEAMIHLVHYLETYDAEKWFTCIKYHEKNKEKDTATMLYHAAKKEIKRFKDYTTKAKDKKYGKAPDDLDDQFAKWLRFWLEKKEGFIEKNDHIGRWINWLKRINSPALEDWLKHLKKERDRRNQLWQAVNKASGKKQKELATQLLEFKNKDDENQYLTLAWSLGNKDPELAHLLYKHALEIEGRNGYKGQAFLRCANNMVAFAIKLKSKEDKEMALKLGVPWGYRNPPIFHNAACLAVQLGKNDEALMYVEYAIKYKFDQVVSLTYKDPDLAPIRKDPRFKKLFEDLV